MTATQRPRSSHRPNGKSNGGLNGSAQHAASSHDARQRAGRPPWGLQAAAREKWLKYREQRLEKAQGKDHDGKADQSKELERTKDRSKKHTPDDDFSLSDRRPVFETRPLQLLTARANVYRAS